MQKEHFVSIGIRVYNKAALLNLSLNSWQKQDCSNIEIIVADGTSTDGMLAICREYVARGQVIC